MSYKHFKIFRRIILIVGILTLVFILFFLGAYLKIYHGRLSKDINDWSGFGSYFSGTVGVLISFLNLLLVIYFTIKIGKAQQQTDLTALRTPFYKEIIDSLSKIKLSSSDKIDVLEKKLSWLEEVDFESYLFLRPDQVEIITSIQRNLLKSLEGFIECIPQEKDQAFSKVLLEKNYLIAELRAVMKEANN